jgi:hypothetical protein
MMAEYRVREARVQVCNGYHCWRERRFVAERRISVLGLLSWWWPVWDFAWRRTEAQAVEDMHWDASMRAPLAKPRLYEVH